MSLLAPWFLAGLVLLAGPVVAHLIRRATRQRVVFSSIRFLNEARPKLERRSRVQHPWLLALRCLILVLLALAFARPYLTGGDTSPAAARVQRHVVLLLDQSASMQRSGLAAAAREHVVAATDRLQPQDRFALVSVGDTVRVPIGEDRWAATPPGERAALITAIVASARPGWGPTPLDAGVEAALEQWEAMAERDGGAAARELVLVSDFAAGSRITGLASVAWPDQARVRLETVRSATSANASLHALGWSRLPTGEPAARVRVSRSFESPGPLHWQRFDAEHGHALGPAESLELLPGTSRVLTVPWPEDVAAVRLELSGDDEPFDNQLWLVRPEPRELAVSFVGPQDSDDPRHAPFFLARALAGLPQPRVSFAVSTSAAVAPGLIIVNGPLEATVAATLRTHLAAGSFVVVLLDDSSVSPPATSLHQAAVETAAQLAGETGWRATVPDRTDALIGQMDFRHPLFAPFADPRYSDFTRIRFWEPRSVQLPVDSAAEVVARFDDGSPAVLEVAVGAGRLIVWGGGWAPAASQWVLSSKFVPFLQALAERAAGGQPATTMAEVGDPITQEIAPPASPGLHRISERGAQRTIALNVPAAESQLDPLPLDRWEQLGVPLDGPETLATIDQRAQQQRRQTAIVLEQEQRLWRALLWAVLAFLVIESLLARKLARTPFRTPAPSPRPTSTATS